MNEQIKLRRYNNSIIFKQRWCKIIFTKLINLFFYKTQSTAANLKTFISQKEKFVKSKLIFFIFLS